MLHPAELEAGDDDAIILFEGAGDARVGFHPVEGLVDQGEDFIELVRLGRVRFAEIDAHGGLLTQAGFLAPFSGGKGKKVGAQGRGFPEADAGPRRGFVPGQLGAIGDCLPSCGEVQAQGIAPFEVRLVEAGEDGPRPVGNEEGVEVFRVAVEGPVAG